MDPSVTFAPGEVPVSLNADQLQIPIEVPGLACACVRGVASEEFGFNLAGAGLIGCGPDGLGEVDYECVIEHDTTNGEPDCRAGMLDAVHPGVCNGLRACRFTGPGPRGSAVVEVNISATLIPDGGSCAYDCGLPANGPDCLPCTIDDADRGEPDLVLFTTGRAVGRVQTLEGVEIRREAEGRPLDCDVLVSDPQRGIMGLKLVSTVPNVDSAQIGDNVITTIIECGN